MTKIDNSSSVQYQVRHVEFTSRLGGQVWTSRRGFYLHFATLSASSNYCDIMESQISVRQSMVEKVKRPFKNNRRLNRFLNSLQLNLTRNSGYYALVSSLMCLCLIGLRTNSEYHDHDEIDSELHYSFHNWEPKVIIANFHIHSFNDLLVHSSHSLFSLFRNRWKFDRVNGWVISIYMKCNV